MKPQVVVYNFLQEAYDNHIHLPLDEKQGKRWEEFVTSFCFSEYLGVYGKPTYPYTNPHLYPVLLSLKSRGKSI